MLFAGHTAIVRGGGDIASGVVYRMHQAGFPIVVLELDQPLTIRRPVSVSTAVLDGSHRVGNRFVGEGPHHDHQRVGVAEFGNVE